MIEKLEAAIRSKGWTQGAFEKAAMLSENRISKWKNDQGEPSASQALRMAKLLGVPVEFLIDDELEEPFDAALSNEEKMLVDMARRLGAKRILKRLEEVGVGAPLRREEEGMDVGSEL